MAVLFRQTSVVWVFYLAASDLLADAEARCDSRSRGRDGTARAPEKGCGSIERWLALFAGKGKRMRFGREKCVTWDTPAAKQGKSCMSQRRELIMGGLMPPFPLFSWSPSPFLMRFCLTRAAQTSFHALHGSPRRCGACEARPCDVTPATPWWGWSLLPSSSGTVASPVGGALDLGVWRQGRVRLVVYFRRSLLRLFGEALRGD